MFATLWLDLIRQLSYMWEANEQYGFGWFVPVLAIGLLIKKWPIRPAPEPTSTPRWLLTLVVLSVFIFLPVRVIHEVNQDWALFTWLLTGSTVVLTLYAVFLTGGWPWVKHFAFPVCFIFVAVRWPYRIENSLTYRLQGFVTVLTVELLMWFGLPVFQHGHMIEVATGMVGVDEACSGIRSFQSSLMAALFLGELYLVRWRARCLLVAAGVAVAFLLNLVRAVILAWQANQNGLSAVDKWHDSAGLTIAVACFFCLWAIALLIRRLSAPPTPDLGPLTSGSTPTSDLRPLTSASERSSVLGPQFPLSAFRFLLFCGIWSFLTIAFTETWYRLPTHNKAATVSWTANLPTNLPTAREIPLSKAVKSKLKYDRASGLSWEEPDGTKWSAYWFRWDPGKSASAMAARDHRPEYCLGGSGYTCRGTFDVRYVSAVGFELPFRSYIYERGGIVLYVFHCLWEDCAGTQKGFGATKYHDRFEAVRSRKRRTGQQTLEVIISSYADMVEAEKAFRARLPELIAPAADQRQIAL